MSWGLSSCNRLYIILPFAILMSWCSLYCYISQGIKISEDFRLFATVSHRERDWCSHIGGLVAFSYLYFALIFLFVMFNMFYHFNIFYGLAGSAALDSNWRKLMVGAPTDNDILDIIKTRYPILEPLAEKIMGITFILVKCYFFSKWQHHTI